MGLIVTYDGMSAEIVPMASGYTVKIGEKSTFCPGYDDAFDVIIDSIFGKAGTKNSRYR